MSLPPGHSPLRNVVPTRLQMARLEATLNEAPDCHEVRIALTLGYSTHIKEQAPFQKRKMPDSGLDEEQRPSKKMSLEASTEEPQPTTSTCGTKVIPISLVSLSTYILSEEEDSGFWIGAFGRRCESHQTNENGGIHGMFSFDVGSQ
jgi:hypothetical protein